MIQQIASQINVSVNPTYLKEYKKRGIEDYVFSYHVTIKNSSPYPVQLISRKWQIFDAIGFHKTVEGEGVVGRQPILEPGQTYMYHSAVSLQSEIGRMSGLYNFIELGSMQEFSVIIPSFDLIVPAKLN